MQKTILITGATGGIGAPLCERLASAGQTVVLAARSIDRLDALSARLEGTGKHTGGRESIWFLFRAAWILLCPAWILLSPAWISLCWIWIRFRRGRGRRGLAFGSRQPLFDLRLDP